MRQQPEIRYNRVKGGKITSCQVNGKFIRLRYWSDWCRLDAHLDKLGWKRNKDTRQLEPAEQFSFSDGHFTTRMVAFSMNLLDETRYRLNACRMGLSSGFGDTQSLRNRLMQVDQRVDKLTPFAKEIEARPDSDEVRSDEDIVALMHEYYGLLITRDSVRQFLGIEPPAEVKPVKKDDQGFRAFTMTQEPDEAWKLRVEIEAMESCLADRLDQRGADILRRGIEEKNEKLKELESDT